jgi:hypothetical protein
MATVASGTRFPSFQQSKDYFSDGIGSAPEFKLTDAPAPGTGGESAPGLDTPSAGAGAASPAAPAAAEPTSLPAAQTLQEPTPGVSAPYDLGFQQTGSLQERLFSPVQAGAETGGEQLEDFASQFRTQAGPERTYEGIGAEGQLAGAVEGTTGTDVGKALVGAQYTGPAGLDPAGSAYLNDLARQLQTRQDMLSTGGGLTTAVQQSTPGLTPGESRFQAQSMFGEGFRDVVPQQTAGVQQFQGALGAETQSALDYAAQRTGQEQAIAQQSRDYLTGRGDVITGDLQQSVAEAQAEDKARVDLWDKIRGGGETADIAGYLQQLQGRGAIDFAGTGGAGEGGQPDVGNILSEIYQGGQSADALQAEIMAKYPGLAGIDPLGRGLSGSGRGTTTYTGEGPEGEAVDYRSLYDKPTRVDLTERQNELNQAFDPLRMARGQGAEAAAFNPLYGGEGFESPDIQEYLGFNPGIRPSRENVSSEEQRTQFNNINDMLGKLDRISEAETPFQAATIAAQIDQYLTDEESSFEEHKGELSKDALAWKSMVKKARKKYKKAKRDQKWGMVLDAVGGITGLPISHQTIGAEGTTAGSVLRGTPSSLVQATAGPAPYGGVGPSSLAEGSQGVASPPFTSAIPV